jgi:hypothetical protein
MSRQGQDAMVRQGQEISGALNQIRESITLQREESKAIMEAVLKVSAGNTRDPELLQALQNIAANTNASRTDMQTLINGTNQSHQTLHQDISAVLCQQSKENAQMIAQTMKEAMEQSMTVSRELATNNQLEMQHFRQYLQGSARVQQIVASRAIADTSDLPPARRPKRASSTVEDLDTMELSAPCLLDSSHLMHSREEPEWLAMTVSPPVAMIPLGTVEPTATSLVPIS